MYTDQKPGPFTLAFGPKPPPNQLRKPVPGNLGPSVQRRRSIHWAHGPEKPEIERVLSFEVESVARLMAEKQWPPRELYLDRCNLSGVDLPVFLETTCARCVFPYCELRG